MQAKFGGLSAHPSVVPVAELAKARCRSQAVWITGIEKGWLEKSPLTAGAPRTRAASGVRGDDQSDQTLSSSVRSI